MGSLKDLSNQTDVRLGNDPPLSDVVETFNKEKGAPNIVNSLQ